MTIEALKSQVKTTKSKFFRRNYAKFYTIGTQLALKNAILKE